MVNAAGGIVIAIIVILIVAGAGWVIFTQLRARRLGVSVAPFFITGFHHSHSLCAILSDL